jgi:hypothetical protein
MASDLITKIIDALKKHHPSAHENELELSVCQTIESLGFEVIKQKSITRRDRLDLFVPILGLGIEIKIAGSYSRVAEQLLRYAEHEEVKALLLVTTRASHRQLHMMPNDRNVPVFVLHTAMFSI